MENSKMKIDKPHPPHGKHVDVVTPFGGGADKIRIDPSGQVKSHEMVLKGGKKIDLSK